MNSRALVMSSMLVATAWGVTPAAAQEYITRVVASGLQRPVGIAVDGSHTVYFTQVPTPGVAGGANGVFSLDLETGVVATIHQGEPEPTNIAIDRTGDLYWTCKSAGVILRSAPGGSAELFAGGLQLPSGIAVDRHGRVYFTEVPDPGVAGAGNQVAVWENGGKMVLSSGEPEPVDVVVSREGTLYWTCRTAGVILRQRDGQTELLASGLDNPTGIAVDHLGRTLYFTEVPTPGVPGSQGGSNAVKAIDLASGAISVIDEGDPEPTDVAVARNGNVYWTCTSAGVIVEAKRRQGR
jgi:glucose/arabinose dehydrogenase